MWRAFTVVVMTGVFVVGLSVSAAEPTRVVRLTNIGGLPIGAPFSDAIRHFGPLGVGGARERFDDTGCTLWNPSLGVSLWYEGNPRENATAETCLYFQGGAVSGPGWHLLNGLAVGDSTSKLRRLFPHVFDTRRPGPRWDNLPGSIAWDITITSGPGGDRPALYAMVKHGRIVGFGIEIVGQ